MLKRVEITFVQFIDRVVDVPVVENSEDPVRFARTTCGTRSIPPISSNDSLTPSDRA